MPSEKHFQTALLKLPLIEQTRRFRTMVSDSILKGSIVVEYRPIILKRLHHEQNRLFRIQYYRLKRLGAC